MANVKRPLTRKAKMKKQGKPDIRLSRRCFYILLSILTAALFFSVAIESALSATPSLAQEEVKEIDYSKAESINDALRTRPETIDYSKIDYNLPDLDYSLLDYSKVDYNKLDYRRVDYEKVDHARVDVDKYMSDNFPAKTLDTQGIKNMAFAADGFAVNGFTKIFPNDYPAGSKFIAHPDGTITVELAEKASIASISSQIITPIELSGKEISLAGDVYNGKVKVFADRVLLEKGSTAQLAKQKTFVQAIENDISVFVDDRQHTEKNFIQFDEKNRKVSLHGTGIATRISQGFPYERIAANGERIAVKNGNANVIFIGKKTFLIPPTAKGEIPVTFENERLPKEEMVVEKDGTISYNIVSDEQKREAAKMLELKGKHEIVSWFAKRAEATYYGNEELGTRIIEFKVLTGFSKDVEKSLKKGTASAEISDSTKQRFSELIDKHGGQFTEENGAKIGFTQIEDYDGVVYLQMKGEIVEQLAVPKDEIGKIHELLFNEYPNLLAMKTGQERAFRNGR